jgi:calcium-dependent protein kinase
MVDMITRGYFSMEGPQWESISDNAKNFVSKLIVVDPKIRLNAAAALKHPWIVSREQLPDEKPSEALLRSIDGSLIHYRQTSALKRLALQIIAHRSTSDEIIALRQAFESFDSERDGVVTFEEFKKALQAMNYSDDTLHDIFSSVDLTHTGKIMYTEFLAATLEAHGHIAEERIAEAFDRMDVDADGYISLDNLKEVMGKHCSPEEVEAVMESGDRDRDGRISWEEFLRAFRTQTRSNVKHVFLPMSADSSAQSSLHSRVDVSLSASVSTDSKVF